MNFPDLGLPNPTIGAMSIAKTATDISKGKDLVMSLQELRSIAFGYGLPIFPPKPSPYYGGKRLDIEEADPGAESSESRASRQYVDIATGRHYLCPVKLRKDGDAEAYVVPNATIAVKATRRLVVTPMVEAGGSVIEEIGMDNYEFTIRGIIISETDKVPLAEMIQLWNYFKESKAVSLINAVSDILMDDSDKVVLRSLDWSDMQGVSQAQGFEITAISDKPFMLTL
jgi:hypothetical protein